MIREDLPKITGKGTYIDDIDPRNTVYLGIIRSPIARGIIKSISRPEKALLTLTWEDVKIYMPVRVDPETLKQSNIVKMPILADGKVNFVGQPVLAYVVEDRYAIEDIADEMSIEYEELKPIIDVEKAMNSDDEIHSGAKRNISVNKLLEGGELSAKKRAEVVVSRKINQARIISNPMEPKGIIAHWDGEYLNIYGSFQSSFRIKNDLRETLNLSPEKIRVYSPQNVGGGFGNKVPAHPEYVIASIASMKLGRPVKWIETRYEHLKNPTVGRGVLSDVKMYATKQGEILGIEGYVAVDLGAYNYTLNPTTPAFIAQLLTGPYKMRFASIRAYGIFTNLPPTGPYRGAGRPEAALIHETLVEDLAEELGVDSVEIRRRNLISDNGYVTPLGVRIDPAGYNEVLNEAEKYYRKAKEVYKDKGVSIVVFTDIIRLSPGEGARVRIENGKIKIFVGTGPHGQAHGDTFSKLASETLGIPQDLIEVITNTTDGVKEGIGSFGSRSATAGGSAVIEACKQLLSKINMPIEKALKEINGVEAEVFYKSDDIFSPGSHVAVVDVDKDTGFVKVLEYYAVDDVGRTLIKEEVEGQIIGGVLQGISQVLWEHAPYDENGNPLFSSIADCGVPTAVEANYKIYVNEVEYPSVTSAKSRGIGEAGTTGALPAVFLALEKITHKKFNKTPIYPWDIIEQ
ncbi:xanthine dehydrogenase family protein molybdopterin-binding subunit [Saccharolobus solfataricus]|uniref:Xanthine dehydrogenase family protein molybdopterin-binding subunit n=2 Tax=Saccharolobus solfataricus TaxID=2287 RepID=A0A0E3KAN0_SACSO|nr:xanthine dehydrogenase family protein molybdopterin-binding subunit [Saccharolobus solfataricus]AKA73107.1 xanthine dehydrogenase family protein molybdopterin-binding subunit [Saccharolobus solfataricus]AKA75805.1 xanthine dehydrogenase family protein molybdopterin-binding subunit [Saccharolobus solfataricus]AKA78497.1 xanthine dehydrogenase family protein molybdopterin-binding subunit [Saccharolobus solfataricus]AZF67606.1 xanthine dehydrogenase family protein molybdopterin-binding subunit 